MHPHGLVQLTKGTTLQFYLPQLSSVQREVYESPVVSLKYSAFRPHIVLMCIIWFSQQTAIISINSINRLVLVAET
jgi:hypothetical protein